MNDVNITDFIDEDYQNNQDFINDYLEEETETEISISDSDEIKLKKSRYCSLDGKYRFFRQECGFYEFSRTPITFIKDNINYHGIVMKELDKTHFIFLIEEENKPGKRMKKFDISDISVYF